MNKGRVARAIAALDCLMTSNQRRRLARSKEMIIRRGLAEYAVSLIGARSRPCRAPRMSCLAGRGCVS